jgi:hypothetical protein
MVTIEGSRWKAALLVLWAVAAAVLVIESADRLGLGGRPWFGWWDAIMVSGSQPFIVQVAQPHAGGAAASGGLRDGDRIDLREHNLDSRVHVMWQLMATQPTLLTIHRSGQSLVRSVTGSTIWDGAPTRRITHVLLVVPALFFLACALLIIRRRNQTYEGRALASFLLCLVIAQMTRPAGFVAPNAALYLITAFASQAFSLAAAFIAILLSSRYGKRSAWRSAVEVASYAANGLNFLGVAAGCIGVWTMWFDPVPFVMGSFWGVFHIAAAATVALVVVAAVACSARSEQPRMGWLLLPLPLIFLVAALLDNTVGVQSWTLLWTILFGASILSFAGASLVTYALLKRRVLDVGFVLSRSIVVAILSVVVVAAFVLLEWILGTVLANVSHATGVAANAALALALGLSIRFIHQRVDNLVDAVMFRKRHEDTNALWDFSKEAAFVTERDALLELALAKIRRHTDAQSAGLFFRENGSYHAMRQFNEVTRAVPENDGAVLALKTWHKPVDPHAYDSVLKGDLALPMVARGQLVGLLLCGERSGGEAYAPDEIDTLAQFAQAVGSAFDGLANGVPAGNDALLDAILDLRKSIDRHFAAE